ncbi:DUF4294 domain-containing protein [Geofilum rubicundum]|uniref:DUF4294 domain-containing protein n=1 Tax=Geofilum rubicundum JCM 15548 TaxID=1236989 RepID=A0A0E9M301_9BACT|nr:DUF4294 domain-containing protein [Geofilum rubicundum]GAO31540.1 hypothetical protein JCM15548_13911 [Geofilum rubicundum JCM 15548]
MRRLVVFLPFYILFVGSLWAQTGVDSVPSKPVRYFLKPEILNGDTLPHVLLDEVTVMKPWEFKSRREYRKYNRLIRNIKVTLPYARLAAEKLALINEELEEIEGKKERRHFVKEAESQLFEEFEAPLRKLTFSQGKLLIRLIDRETGDNSYNLIKEYKGGVPAFFWQGIARIFGANLKDEYNAEEDDKMIEHIIQMIDAGAL